MSDRKPPEGARWTVPNWDPSSDDESVRPYLDRVAYLEDQLKCNGQPEKTATEDSLKKEKEAATRAATKAIAIKLDAAARQVPAPRITDIDSKFDTLETLLKEAGRLRIEGELHGAPYYAMREAMRDAPSEPYRSDWLTLGQLEVARGHFHLWHGQTPPPEPPPSSKVLDLIRKVFGISKAHQRATAHLRAYFGQSFEREAREHFRRPRWVSTSLAIVLTIVLLNQGFESEEDLYDDRLGYFQRILYNLAKVPVILPGNGYENRMINSKSEHVIANSLAHYFWNQREAASKVLEHEDFINVALRINNTIEEGAPGKSLTAEELKSLEPVLVEKMVEYYRVNQFLTYGQAVDAFEKTLDQEQKGSLGTFLEILSIKNRLREERLVNEPIRN